MNSSATRPLMIVLLSLLLCLPALGQEILTPRPGALTPPDPQYTWHVERSVFVPMRDGIKLSTDLYFPDGVDRPLGTVMVRTPYDKDTWDPEQGGGIQGRAVDFFASQGFAVVVQDTRGKFESEGSYTLNLGYRDDAFDTIGWIGEQDWSNSRVGSYGCSYQGENQLYMAPGRHPGLAAMIPQHGTTGTGSAGGFYGLAHDFTAGGIHLAGVLLWHHYYLHKSYDRLPSSLTREEFLERRKTYELGPTVPPIEDPEALYWTLPVIDMLDRAGGPPTDWRDFIVHQNDVTDPWWDKFDYVTDDEPVDAPSLFIESWGDFTARPAFYIRDLYERTAVSAKARDNQFMIISPSQHCASESLPESTVMGELDFGDPRFGHFSIYLDWFDYWLNGNENGITEMPKIQYYMMGRNEWRATNEWPPEGVENQKWYLHSNGNANTHDGDGTLSLSEPANEASDGFTYDPANPVPSLGGPYSSGIGSAPYLDQRPVSSREDVLVYTSEPLEDGLELEGPIDAVLYVSSSAKDTDFSVKLVDVHPDGTPVNIRVGFLRARYRDGRDRQVFMESGQTYEVPVSLNDTAYYVKPGHRLRIQITSSDFPSYDRNLNTGGKNYDETEWVIAENEVHHSGVRASYITLPVSR